MSTESRAASDGVPAAIHVLIVDNHELFSTALRMALCQHGLDAHQVAPTSLDAVLAVAGRLPAGLVLLDLRLGDDDDAARLTGLDLIAPLRKLRWAVLVLTGSQNETAEDAALAAGAMCAMQKSCGFEELLRVVLTAAAGKPVMGDAARRARLVRHSGHRAEHRAAERRLHNLTARERQVLDLLADGYRAARIAKTFVVSLATVRAQIRAILCKLEVNSQLEAVALLHCSKNG